MTFIYFHDFNLYFHILSWCWIDGTWASRMSQVSSIDIGNVWKCPVVRSPFCVLKQLLIIGFSLVCKLVMHPFSSSLHVNDIPNTLLFGCFIMFHSYRGFSSSNGGTPESSHFDRMFHYTPSGYRGTPMLGNPHLVGSRSFERCLGWRLPLLEPS